MLLFSGLFSFYREAYGAVTDFSFYRQVFHQPLRRTLFFLLYLSAHVAVILTLLYAWIYGPYLQGLTRWARQNWPPFEVSEGVLRVEAPQQPLILTYPGEPPVVFVFDGSEDFQEPRNLPDPIFLFTRDKLVFRYGERTQTHLWRDLGSFRIGPREIEEMEAILPWLYFPVAYSFWLLWNLVGKSLMALLLTFFGLLAASRYQVRLRLGEYFTIALYALTPAIIIDLAVKATWVMIPIFPLIYLGTAGLYTYLATQKVVAIES